MFDGQNYYYHPSPYIHNMYEQQNFIGNNNMNQMRYNKYFISDSTEINPLHKKNKTPDYKKFNSNNLRKDFKSNENLYYQYDNTKINNNNGDFMKWKNLNKNQMNETNNKAQCDFNFKQSEDIKKQIPAQRINKKSNFDREILKLFIYIYYYEKIVLEKNLFYNSDKDFYLINPEWIIKFKELFYCDKVEKRLELFYFYQMIQKNIAFF